MSKTIKTRWIGDRLQRVDAAAKLDGSCRFLSDIPFAGLLHTRQVVSPHPHALIRGLDCAAARAMSGVRALLTADEIPGENRIGVIIDDQPLLAHDRVRHIGETVAIVAAETPVQADSAAVAVIVDYDPLPAIFDLEHIDPTITSIPDSGHADPATGTSIHDSGPIASHYRARRGDIATGFTASDVVVEGVFRTGAQEHIYLEPQGCVALPENGGLTIFGSMQCPFYVQKAVARVCGLPLAKVRVIQTPTGGGFGGKEDIPNELCARAALLALATRRPVRLLLDRREDIAQTSKRHPFRIHGRLGATRDGRFQAMQIFSDADSGAYATLSPPVIFRAAVQGAGPYEIPHVEVEARGWYTNNVPNGAFRGFGSPQACFGHERLVDLMAAELGIDPVELRRINMLRQGGTTSTGQVLTESVGALTTLDRCADAAAFSPRTGEQADTPTRADIELAPELAEDPSRWLMGSGCASMLYGNCLGKAGWHMDGAGAYLQILKDGSVSCSVGLVEMGQGARTVVTQFVSDALGISPTRITLTPVDTALVPDSGPTVASRNVVMSGNAILAAAEKLKNRLAPLAAEMLGCSPDRVIFHDDQVAPDDAGDPPETKTPAGSSTAIIPFEDLAASAFAANLNLAAEGWWHSPDLDFDLAAGTGDPYFAYSFATQIARVAVDRLTGMVKVLKVWAAHDLGRAINPAGVEGQVEGGVVQGLGWALTEQFACKDGRVLSDSLTLYQIPCTLDAPEIETIIVEDPHSQGPLGAKSLGEPVIIPTAAAIVGAVSAALGVPINEIPLIPEQILVKLEADADA